VLLEAVEDESGGVVLSYRKAKRQKEWEDVIAKHKEGDVVSGPVTRKIKGGLLVNIGVNVFLPPARWTSAGRRHRPLLGKTIECRSSPSTSIATTSSSAGASSSKTSATR